MFSSILRNQVRLHLGSICKASTALRASRNLSSLAIPRRHALSSTVFSRNLSDSALPSTPPSQPSLTFTNTLHVNNVPWPATAAELSPIFAEFGTVKDVRVARAYNSAKVTYAFIEFDSVKSATEAFMSCREGKPIQLRGNDLYVSPGLHSEQKARNILKISGLTDERLIRDLFKGFKIADVRVVGGHGPLVFVNFDSPQTAAKALEKVKSLRMEFRFGESRRRKNNQKNTLVCDGEHVNVSVFEGFNIMNIHRAAPYEGAAFVQFEDAEIAAKAYMNAVSQCTIPISFATAPKPKGQPAQKSKAAF